MANEEHLRKLMEGIKDWNFWRKGASSITPDLTDADLASLDLSAVDLSDALVCRANCNGTNFNNANLKRLWAGRSTSFHKADLTYAYLNNANLKEVNLNGAILKGCDLQGADLTLASCRGANFFGANLSRTTFKQTDLADAILDEAIVRHTSFADVDLSSVSGLETVRHVGPSTIGVDTLMRSGNCIPQSFFKGAGLSDELITFLPSLLQQPIQFYSCFISYCHEDKAFARVLYDSLQSQGIRCWLDERQLLPGDKIYTEVDRGIRLSEKILLCCSESALKSWWVDNEIKIAFAKEQQLWRERGTEVLSLVPVNLDNYLFRWASGLATEVKARVAADFVGWQRDPKKFAEQMERLIKSLRVGPVIRLC